MSTKTNKQTANLAILTDKCCDTDEDFKLFADNLARWCEQWIPEIAVPIMRKAHDLYGNAAIRILLGEWYDLKLKSVRDMHERLLRAANYEELDMESEGGKYEFAETVYRREMGSYSDALYALLVR